MTESFLPYGRQWIDDDDIEAVRAVLQSDYLTTGPAVDAFEAALMTVTGAPDAVACNSGTAALHLAMLALGIGPGDAVVVPTVTFLATANAARYVGAEVIFSDVDPDTGIMTDANLEEALRRAGRAQVKAVLPVHLGGQTPDLAAISAVATPLGIAVIDDACHNIGGHYGAGDHAEPVGACGHTTMSAFSFHPAKTVTMGEGGAVTIADAELAQRLRDFRNHGMTRDPERYTNAGAARDADGTVNPWYYEMAQPGFNYRASDIQCALGTSQLAKLSSFVDRRRALVSLYDRQLAALAPVVLPPARLETGNPAWHLYAARIDFDAVGQSRASVMNGLREQGIGSQVHYIPVHTQPYYHDLYGEIPLPGADAYYSRTLSLPLYPSMNDDDVVRVAEALARALEHH